MHRETLVAHVEIKLSPWIKDLLEKLIVPQIVKKFLAFYGTRKFITVFTTARHWFLF
jgi:hypothetical protein